ncbi:hypothetical protein COEREDRAFT_88386 [Coemansia reversa NRRL 1564]|uniref:Uncharacterized protein n=1 Tax=Coemansia reversa (strain ATCC 12441 / NRRL 1564) TaxID=763665 RepID=A0A2G5B776_COERN|nr:hypothetical protein COEREDRAFT_88386 [Coemansia reversa NRRL 1564]|eukprot:PIA14865.1 hypothetical protein COEREDRAFT_88386 [Coemansia reversa NRRL 1564]
MGLFHRHRKMQVDPQVCVSAGTTGNPPTALKRDSTSSHDEHRQSRQCSAKELGIHYTIQNKHVVVPAQHPNAGIGGYHIVPCRSNIGGYYKIDRESEIGNDHEIGSKYWVEHMMHKASHHLEKSNKEKH